MYVCKSVCDCVCVWYKYYNKHAWSLFSLSACRDEAAAPTAIVLLIMFYVFVFTQFAWTI